VTDARGEILRALRAARPPAAPHPGFEGPWSAAPDRAAAFRRAVEAAGGSVLAVAGAQELGSTLASLPAYARAARVLSLVPGVARANVALAAVSDARALDGLDFAVLPGALGVAENGAVFVDAGALRHRPALWLAEHLALVLPEAALVDHLHDAYARLRFSAPGLGVFVAGPSKTADIEQALVVGAQGPRSTTVVLLR
jgi:L-lactate dehydrogenase complex protein LldG